MYTPFCSVEIAFGNMESLKQLITSGSDEEKLVIVCDKFTTDLWQVTGLIERAQQAGHVAWIDKCPPNPTQGEVVKALHVVGDLNPSRILAIGGGSTIDIGKAISAFYYMLQGEEVTEAVITEALKSGSYKQPHPLLI